LFNIKFYIIFVESSLTTSFKI